MRSTSPPARLVALLVGLVLFGVGEGLMVTAAIGVSPWAVLAQGVAELTGLSFGLVTNLIGAAVLLLWIPLRQRPGIGTVLNVLIVGSAAQVAISLVTTPPGVVLQALLFAAGLLAVAVGTGIYVGADYGAGPRDGLMTGLARRAGWPIWLARGSIELTVLVSGWLLGGDVGVGTVAFAVFVGPLCHLTIPFFARRIRPAEATALAGSVPPSTQVD